MSYKYTGAPMNTAHHHAANADEYLAKGMLVLALQEHREAAKAYMLSLEGSNDDSAKRTLRMLYNEHCKTVKDIQRRIDKLIEEGQDPSLPQKSEAAKTDVPRHAHSGPSRCTASPPPQRPLTDSQNAADESFMLLGGQRSDPGDAFNQFWNIMQGMLENLSQPVAFATVPLGNQEPDPASKSGPKSSGSAMLPRRDGSLSSDTDPEEPMFSRFTRRIGLARDGSHTFRTGLGASSKFSSNLDDFDELLDEGDELSESFFLIPSGSEASPSLLRKENTALKAEIAALQKRLEATDRVIRMRKEQDVHLRESIVLATREAHRVMGASTVLQRPNLDFNNLNMNVPAVPIPGLNSSRDAQYSRRVKELEEDLRLIRAENEKHKAVIVKFRERWEKLKESAKRKKEAKAAAEASTNGVRERIDEEPEVEEGLDSATIAT